MIELKSAFFSLDNLRKETEIMKNEIEDDSSKIERLTNYLVWEIADLMKALKNKKNLDIDFDYKKDKLKELSKWIREAEGIEEQKFLFYDLVDLYEEIKSYYLENTKIKDVTAEVKYEEALEKAQEESKRLLEEYKKMPVAYLESLEDWWNADLEELNKDWETNAPTEAFEIYQKLKEMGAFKYAEKFKNFYMQEVKKRVEQIKKLKQDKLLEKQNQKVRETKEQKPVINEDVVKEDQLSEKSEHKIEKDEQKEKQEDIEEQPAEKAPAVPKEIEEEFHLHEEWLSADRRKPRFKIVFYDNKSKKLGVVFYGRRGRKRKEEKTIDEMRQIIADGGYKVFDVREVEARSKFTKEEELKKEEIRKGLELKKELEKEPEKTKEKSREESTTEQKIKQKDDERIILEKMFDRIKSGYRDNPQIRKEHLESLLKRVRNEKEVIEEDRIQKKLVMLEKDIIAAINKAEDEILEKNKEVEETEEKSNEVKLETEEESKEEAAQEETIKEKTVEEYLEELGFKVKIEDLESEIKYEVDKSGEIKIEEKSKKDILDILKNLRGAENLTEEERELIIQNTAAILDDAVNREAEREFSKVWKHHKRVLLAGGLISLVAGVAGMGVRMAAGGIITKTAGSLAGGILGAGAGFVRAWARERFNPILEKIKRDNLKKFRKVKEEKAEELLSQENIKIILLQELRKSLVNKIIDTSHLSKKTKIEEYKRLVQKFIDHNEELKLLEKNKKEKLVSSLSALALVANENSQMFSDLLNKEGKVKIKTKEKTRAAMRGGALGLLAGIANSFSNIPNASYIFSGAISGIAIGGAVNTWMKRKSHEYAIEDIAMTAENIMDKENIKPKDVDKLYTLLKSGVLDQYPVIKEKTREFLAKNALDNLLNGEIDKEFTKELESKIKEQKLLKYLRHVAAYGLGFTVGLATGIIGRTMVAKAEELFSPGLIQEKPSNIKGLTRSLLIGVPEDTKEAISQDESSVKYLQQINNFINELGLRRDVDSQAAREEIEKTLQEIVKDGKIDDSEYQRILDIYKKVFSPPATATTETSTSPESPKVEILSEGGESDAQPEDVQSEKQEEVEDIKKEVVVIKKEKTSEPIEIKIEGKIDTFSEAIYEAAKEAYNNKDYQRVDNFIHNVLGDEVKIDDQDRFKLLQKAVRVLSVKNVGEVGDESVKNLVYEGNVVKLNADGTWSVEKAGGDYEPQAVTEEQLRENAHHIEENEERVKILSLKEASPQLKESLGFSNEEENEDIVIVQFNKNSIQIKIDDETVKIDFQKGNWKIEECNLEGELDKIPESNKIKYFKELIEEAKHPFEKDELWEKGEIKLDDGHVAHQLRAEGPIKYFDVEEDGVFDKIPDIAQIGDTYIYREDNENWHQFNSRVIKEYMAISHEKEQLLDKFEFTKDDIKQYGIENIVTENNLEEKLEFIRLHRENWSPEKIRAFFAVSEELNKDYNDNSFNKLFEKLDPSFYKNPQLAKALIELNEEKYNQGIKDLLRPALLTYDRQRGFEYKDGLLKIKGVHDGRGSEYSILIDLKNNKIGLDGPGKWNFGTKGWFKAKPALELTADNVKAVLNKVHEFSAQSLGIER